ncbi:ubiquitin 3 binding protein But2 C-terminal domain-containing protein [Macrophomina phaseolina]|uniref:Ubiquitin 3 binding protein But2 C-terminal domain-containing protein n=1 Tax=Macrophomina phaseolina TaxID=35725 RepID=A0ABQ8G3Q8_9PEZI|nr:ubiquitin 3 binding protein But2 C-terminal domain-containing protein [Macrophomina phaseolina]
MKYAFSPLRSDCCFQLTASGGASGTVGQLNDGQNRVGGDYDAAKYCINSNGGITDSNGRGCILTPPTTQFQCDEGASPTTGFSIGQGGEVTYNGSTQFYACPAADGEYNIYTKPVEGQDKCVEITLSTSGKCASGGQQESSSAPALSTTAQSSAPVQSSTPVASAPPASTPSPVAPSSSPEPVTSVVVTQTTTECPTTSGAASTPVPSAPAPEHSSSAASLPPPVQSPPPVPSSEQSPPPAATTPASPEHTTLTTTQAASTHTSVESVTVPTPSPSAPAPSQPAGTPSSSAVESQHSSAPTPAGTPTPSSSGSGQACPTDLAGDYQYPHLIVPVNASTPSTAYGTQYNGAISTTPQVCSLFNFDIPSDWSGSTCSSIFLLPQKAELETSDYTLAGTGEAVFKSLKEAASESTSWENKPQVEAELGAWGIESGTRFVVKSGECEAGKTAAVEVCAQGGLALEWFQDWNPSPIGLFVRRC